jgi:uncharacterized membrane protein (UPF0127 family)
MKPFRKSTIFLALMAIILLGILGAAVTPRGDGQKSLPKECLAIINAKGERCLFIVELAVTPEEQEKGLMFRRTLAPDAGMLFVLATPQIVDFWMKNTILPLDMIFIRKDGTVDAIVRNAVPYSLTNIFSTGPVIATLEVPAGTAGRLNLQPADKVIARQFPVN